MGNNYEYSKGYCEGYIDGHRKAQGQNSPVSYSDSMKKIELEDETDSSLGAKIRKIAESFAQEPTEVDSVSDRLFKSMKEEILKTNERIRLLEDIVKGTPRSNMVEALQEVLEDVQGEIRLKERDINETAHNTLEENENKDLPANLCLPENIQRTFGRLSLTKAVLKLFHYKKKWKSSEMSSVLKNVHFKNTKVTSENFNNNLSASLALLKRQGKIISINGVYNLALKEKVDDNDTI